MINVKQKGISARLSVITLAFGAEYTNCMTGYVVVVIVRHYPSRT
ncbi:MAG: hypothetical protein WB053_02400 [Nitrososphaeraceae archaeon]